MASRTLSSLPVIQPQTPERADAARNRLKILEAAERLIAKHRIEHVSMDMLAEEACVGKGTIFAASETARAWPGTSSTSTSARSRTASSTASLRLAPAPRRPSGYARSDTG